MNTNATLMDTDESARRRMGSLVRRSGTSFYWAMRLLPEPRRSSMFAIYAFCRAVDDIADGSGTPAEKRRALAGYRDRITEICDTRQAVANDDPAGLVPAIERYDLKVADFHAVIDGMETDASDSVRMADDDALALYIDRVACAVGRLSCRVFGLPAAIHRPLAGSLGMAFQITNILRDLREDAARNRVYLPQSTLQELDLDGLGPVELLAAPQLAEACLPLVRRAESNYAAADQLMNDCEPRLIKPARMMRAAYGRLFDKVVTAGFAPLPECRVSLGRHEKLAVALRHGFF
ncbi:MAG: squalene/phytoene synthase family protein [Rhodospirillales bacterium]